MNKNVTAIILIVLAIGVYLTFTQARLDETKAIQEVNKQYLSAIANADQLIKVRDRVMEQYNNISAEDRDRLDKALPNSVDNIRLIIDLNSIAANHGFSLRNIRAAASSASTGSGTIVTQRSSASGISNPTLDTVTVSFSVTAPYQQFVEFMRSLEANLRIMDLTKLTVAANTGGTYDFSVELQTYWLRQ